jgi:two-component system nitrate/nitrite response regulator NarL
MRTTMFPEAHDLGAEVFDPQVEDAASRTAETLPSVLIVSDVRLYREGLAAMLANTRRVNVAKAVPEADLSSYLREFAGIVLVDMQLLKARRSLAALGFSPEARIIAFAVSESAEDFLACASFKLSGFVGKEASVGEILAVIEGVLRDELPCPPRLVRMIFQHLTTLVQSQEDWQGPGALTNREVEVARFLDQGYSNKRIARELDIGVTTVKNHVHHILEKLNVHRRGEASAALRAMLHPKSQER